MVLTCTAKQKGSKEGRPHAAPYWCKRNMSKEIMGKVNIINVIGCE